MLRRLETVKYCTHADGVGYVFFFSCLFFNFRLVFRHLTE